MSHNATMHNTTIPGETDFQSYYGKIMPRGLIPGYVVLSFIISYVGSWTTLELINRRTSSKGLYNWSLLGGAAISMGGIGIWGMHFIGNRAIILGNGSPALQISYDSGFTAFSFFLPIVVLFMAFAAVGANEVVSFVRLGLGGTLAGLGVCGMHYLGQASVTNYDCIYYVAYVVGAAIVAVTAASAALGIFFVFRAAWNAAWWKRGLCALILAGAVSGMHWLASVGTQYRLRQNLGFTSNDSRNATTISVIALSIGGCFILLVSTLLAQARKKRLAKKAKQIILAAAIFDVDNKVLVKSDGLLPTKKITDSYREQTANDVFGMTHPGFLWMYRASCNWPGIASLVPAMREQLHRVGLRNRLGIDFDDNAAKEEEDVSIEEYSLKFRELFCAAAGELADDMGHPVENLGKLFDEIVHSGKAPSKGKKKDLEVGVRDALGKGQILFLVRVVDKVGAQQLQAAGFRFATMQNVLPLNTSILQIGGDDLSRQLTVMQQFAADPPMVDAGCHLAFFAVRASMSTGFDILVRQDARNLIPTMQLPFDTLEPWQMEYLRSMDTQTVAATMKQLNKASRAAATPPKEKEFAAQILHSLEALKDEIEDPFFNDAMLIAKPVQIPCRAPTEDSPPGAATLIVFRAIVPIGSRAPGKKLAFTPFVFFKMQQHVYKNSPDHAIFARRAFREFAPILHRSGRSSIAAAGGKFQIGSADQALAPPSTMAALRRSSPGVSRLFGRRSSRHEARVRGDSSSQKSLVDVGSEYQEGAGGIMVSQEVRVDVEKGPASPANAGDKKSAGIEMAQLSKKLNPGIAAKDLPLVEAPSYVDELFKTTVQARTVR